MGWFLKARGWAISCLWMPGRSRGGYFRVCCSMRQSPVVGPIGSRQPCQAYCYWLSLCGLAARRNPKQLASQTAARVTGGKPAAPPPPPPRHPVRSCRYVHGLPFLSLSFHSMATVPCLCTIPQPPCPGGPASGGTPAPNPAHETRPAGGTWPCTKGARPTRSP